ncbi:MAG: nucleotidyltransferase domain-containing protein [Elusimicrobia bacterium]|nr:nucleotidyltransferase domain-containing protein [Elusimicrobiota bacterium]
MTKRNGIDLGTLQSIAWRIGSKLNAEKVILFGSYAWGNPGPDSDVDLFVVMKSKERPADRAMRVSDLLYPRPFPVDIMVRTPQEIKKRLSIGDFFIEEIVKKGKVLYERRPGQGMA